MHVHRVQRKRTLLHLEPPSLVRHSCCVCTLAAASYPVCTRAAPVSASVNPTQDQDVAPAGVCGVVQLAPASVVNCGEALAPLRISIAVLSDAGASLAEFTRPGGVCSGANVTPPSVERAAPAIIPVG